MISFREFLVEAHYMLDVSILAADKYITSDAKLEKILFEPVVIEAKTDGVKLTVYKKANEGNINDWIFSYKNHILYPDEYDWQPNTKVNVESVGASQFKKVFEHFKKLGKTNIPIGTELQCEFLMRKNTLSSNYEKPHGIVLIQYCKSTYNEDKAQFGILETKTGAPQTAKRDDYAKELKLNVPLKLFDGVLGTARDFEKGMLYNDLKNEYMKVKSSIKWEDNKLLYNDLKQIFLNVPSMFGGKEEGVVLKYDGLLLKWQQEYQLDQNARAKIKQKYKEDNPELENKYWENVKGSAYELVNMVTTNVKNISNLEVLLKELSLLLKRYKPKYEHSKKTVANIKDDIQLNAKTLLIKRLKNNNNCLMLGKFRIFTNGHLKVLKNALKEFDNVCVCLVTGKDTKDTHDLRLKALKKIVEGNKRIQVIESSSGNIVRLCAEKAPFNINAVYTGTDRVGSYTTQLSSSIGMSVKEVMRSDSDISATKVIENISDRKFFETNVPKVLHTMYNEYVKTYGE